MRIPNRNSDRNSNRKVLWVERHSNRIVPEVLGEVLDPSGLKTVVTKKTSSPWHSELSITMEHTNPDATVLMGKKEVARLSYHGTLALINSLSKNLFEIEDMIRRYEEGEPRMVRGANRLDRVYDSQIETYFYKHPTMVLKDFSGTDVEYHLRINWRGSPVRYSIHDFRTMLPSIIQVLEGSL